MDRTTNRSSSSRYLRKGRADGARNLLGAAGLTSRPTIEQLERRQMLFSLTITANDVNANTQLGTVRAFFGYALPYIGSNILVQPATDPTTTTESFTDDAYGAAAGRLLTQSGIQITSNINPPGDLRISAQPAETQDNQNRFLLVNQNEVGEYFQFQFVTPVNPQPGQVTVPVAVSQARLSFDTFGVNDATGLLVAQVVVELTIGSGAARQVVDTFDTAAQIIAAFGGGANAVNGVGTATFAARNGGQFDAIRITMRTPPGVGVDPRFKVTTVAYDVPTVRFGELVRSRLAYAEVAFTGPVGASVSFFDLYQRDMRNTLIIDRRTATFTGSPAIDINDDGVPDFNDGIGSIHFRGTDSRTSFTMFGGGVQAFTDTVPTGIDFAENFPGTGGLAFTVNRVLAGTYDDFESAGFAYDYRVQGQDLTFSGLPPGPGSVVVGAPTSMLRPQQNYQPTVDLAAPATGFISPVQGVFIDDSRNMGSVYIHGILHGSSQFHGFVNQIYVGYLVGSISVDGDLGSLMTGTDAGLWENDPDINGPVADIIFKTFSQLNVGRTVGEIAIGGRSLLDVQVLGDLNSPTTRPARDVYNYYEREYTNERITGTPLDTIRDVIGANADVSARDPGTLFGTGVPRGQAPIFGLNYFRNDQLVGAEWVGSISSSVLIHGDLSGFDPTQSDDNVDVYAFASDGLQDIVIEASNTRDTGEVAPITSPYVRIVDASGHTLAAPQAPNFDASARATRLTTGDVTTLRYRPKSPGVYYIVIADREDDSRGQAADPFAVADAYVMNVTGMTVATLGAYRTAGGSGGSTISQSNTVQVLAGNIGSLRIGTGSVSSAGAAIDPTATYNTVVGGDDSMAFAGGSYSLPGTLYNLTTGSDIGFPRINRGASVDGTNINIVVGGDFGDLVTGLSPAVANAVTEGDINNFRLSVGGRIASILVRGGSGFDQDRGAPLDFEPLLDSRVVITSGTSGGSGDIGMIRFGSHVAGDSFEIHTSPNSTIGAFLVSQDVAVDVNNPGQFQGIFFGARGVPIITGPGSDVRFVDTPRIDLSNSRNVVNQLLGGRTTEIVDDAGSRVQITVENGAEGAVVGSVRTLPIDGSQGAAIGRIVVDLSGGATLTISGISNGNGRVISIGHIIVTNSGAASTINFTGTVPIDVYRIESAGPLDAINNPTGGDIVAIDVASLNRINMTGDLGRTTVPAWGPDLIGPVLGLAKNLTTAVGGPLGLAGNVADNAYFPLWGTLINRPINNSVFSNENVALEDIGSPLEVTLNGLVVRTGNLQEGLFAGTVGDVILQGATGTIVTLTANSDHISPFNRFEGISGHIFAANIQQIDIGDGLEKSDVGPFATTGIVAFNDIGTVTSSRGATVPGTPGVPTPPSNGPVISGTINAFSAVDDFPGDGSIGYDGINNITITNGIFKDAIISGDNLDGFFNSFVYPDAQFANADLGNIRLVNTTLFRSRVSAVVINDLTLSGEKGYFDASDLDAVGDIRNISATGYRNSTLAGTLQELHVNRIQGARDVDTITAIADMDDLVIDITGSVRRSITAVNASRSSIDVDGELKALTLLKDLRGSSVTAGSIPALAVTRNIQSSSIFVSGTLTAVTAGDRIANSDIETTGPGGSIGTITALNQVSGIIRSTGSIGAITSTAGDVSLELSTTNGGAVTSVSAGRDLNIAGDVSGSVTTLIAGRNFGVQSSPRVFMVRGSLTTATIASGQLYNDLRVGEGILGVVTLGGTTNRVGAAFAGGGSLIAFGGIAGVIINGDFDGDILSYSGNIASIAINNGSFLPGNTIAAYNGSLTSVIITNGNLYGNVHADVDITALSVLAGSNGVFGDIGVNPANSAIVPVDSRRNQLPPGVVATSDGQGPVISAGRDIVSIAVPGGSAFETYFTAGRNITAINIGGTVQNDLVTTGIRSAFIAGDTITSVTVSGGTNNTAFVAGVTDLGADGRLGGTGLNADVVKPGTIKLVTIGNGIVDAKFTAGIDAGADGLYNTADDRSVQGVSSIDRLAISGPVVNVSAFGDKLGASVASDERLTRGNTSLPSTNPQIDSGVGTPGVAFSGTRTFDNVNGASITFKVSGPGEAFFNTGSNTLVLRNTTSATNLTVSSSNGVINNVDVVTNDDAALGIVTFNGAVTGDSDLIVDGAITTLTYGDFSGTGSISTGGNITTATFSSFTGGSLTSRNVAALAVTGRFGDPAVATRPVISLLNAGTITLGGTAAGVISVDRDATSLVASGAVDRSLFRFGGSLGAFSAPSLNRTILSAGNDLGPITIVRDVTQSNIAAGADLGRNASPSGNGLDRDTVSSGNIGAVLIGGNFLQSSITAGYLRGADGYFGTGDDTVAGGRSTIASVTIGGTQTGSTRSSEAYRIASNGTVGPVTIGGVLFTGTNGNFAVETPSLPPEALRIESVDVEVVSFVYTAVLTFNQPINTSTVAASLSVSEVRGVSGNVEVRLVEGLDYTINPPTADSNTLSITFSQTVTNRNQPPVPGVPGPGVYRFRLDPSRLRARLSDTALDGNGDGLSPANDNFSQDAIVGDAGDKITPGFANVGNPGALNHRVDFYGPTNLNLVLDNNRTPDSLPDPNTTVTVSGFIGDHPDLDVNFFRAGGDVDLYQITLQAGQILRLGSLRDNALSSPVGIYSTAGNFLGNRFFTVSDDLVLLYAPARLTEADIPSTVASDFLVKTTGTYLIAVGDTAAIASNAVNNPEAVPGATGPYHFTVSVFDDGDSGFSESTGAGNSTDVVNAPAAADFAGVDQVLGTADDLPSRTVGNFNFTYSRGADGIANTSDDLVTGSSSDGQITSTRATDGTLTSVISSAIGPAGHSGVPDDVTADVDIFRLNNGNTIAAGTRLTVTVKLTDLGADLGSTMYNTNLETRGAVQFGIFDVTNSTGIDDGVLVFSPTDFKPNGGTPNTVIADNGSTRYGFDSNGDFFISFLAPGQVGGAIDASKLAVYIQGIRNTDYQIQVVTGTTAAPTRTHVVQNFFIETNGGSINWLEAAQQTTTLLPFDPATLAFAGSINGQPVRNYILTNLVAQLNSLFQGLDIHFSTNPADFEFQPFSTIFLTSSVDPVAPIFEPFQDLLNNENVGTVTGGRNGEIAANAANTLRTLFQPYGYSEHVDALNADLNDEAAVFVPSFALQGFTPSPADVAEFVKSTTAAVARRAGELMGLRLTADQFGGGDPFAADSVDTRPTYFVSNTNRPLSDATDSVRRTDFYLGQQNARSLLDRVLNRL